MSALVRRCPPGHDLVSPASERGHPSQVRAQLAARRWQRLGFVIVLHNGPLSPRQRWVVARLHCGPDAVLTAFTAASAHGLRGWERDETHILAPAGTRVRRECPAPVRLHLAGDWAAVATHPRGGVHALPDALLRGAATFRSPRPACGILAAAVQQRLLGVASLQEAVGRAPRLRHRRAIVAALADIAQGAQALSEVDFVRLCRRFALPAPQQQTVRRDSRGRRRYLDATWRRADGRLVVAEVDGALHLDASRWWDDQQRQNELSLAGALVLRFPSVVVRTEPAHVAAALRRALLVRP